MKIKMKNSALAALFLTSAALISGCGKDDEHNHPAHDQELITTVGLFLTHPTDSTLNTSITFRDLDGDGGQDGVITPDTLRLLPNISYQARLFILDESDLGNTKNIALEIQRESDSHQFFYTPSAGLNLTVTNLDHDTNHKPLGLKADVTTAGASRGSLRISLSHYDAVPKDGVTPSGETDVEVSFPVRIEQ